MTVLVVDDDCGFRRVVQSMVDGVSVVEASTLAEGVKVAKTLQPDVVVLSAEFRGLKKVKGSALIPRFRRAAPSSEIVMTAKRWGVRDSERAVKLGAFAHVQKKNVDLIRVLINAAPVCLAPELPRRAPSSIH
jgi:CheY-like chemotaxis protein